MTAGPDKYLVLPLNGGVTEGVVEDTAGGIIMRSENTRLTKIKGTVSRRPLSVQISGADYTKRCGGMVLGGRKSVCSYFEDGEHIRITDTVCEPVISTAVGTAGANAYYPYPLVDSGTLSGKQVQVSPAVCFDDAGQQWFASSKVVAGTTTGIFVAVIDDGRDVLTPRAIVTRTGIQVWLGITPVTGGVVVWYETGTGIYAIRCSVSGTTLTTSAPVFIYNPVKPSGFIQADVTSDALSATAWLACRDNASNILFNLHRIDLNTLTITNSIAINGIVANTAPPVYIAVTYVFGTNRVALATSEGAGVTFKGVYTATLTNVWNVTGAGRYGAVSVLPWRRTGFDYWVFAQEITGTTLGVNGSAVIFDTHTQVNSTVVDTGYAYWYGLQGKGAYHVVSGGQQTHPYFPLYARWGQGGAPPTVPGGSPTFFMDTPSVEVVTPFSTTVYTPVMRFGVDLVSQYSSILFNSAPTAVSDDGKICFTYVADRFDQPSASNTLFNSRYVVFDLRPTQQFASAVDAGNVGVVGSGMPAAWDGIETTEYAPFHRPKIQVNTSGGGGPNLTGTFAYTAVVSWTDASGNVRRSAPALPMTVVLAGTKPQIYVTMPLTMRSGIRQETFDIDIYSTVDTGAIFIATDARSITRGTVGCWKFDDIYAAVPGDVELYSQFSGIQPLQPECPPPIWDIRSISGRLWLIDAENRFRLLPSLLKQEGIAFEFNSNLQITGFDQQYGKLMAVADVSGSPVVFSERGIWQVDGYGPDNAGQGGSFVDPRLISNMGCRSRESVAQIPGVGVMFQANDGRMCLLAGGFKRFETFDVYDVQVPTVHLLENEIIYPLSNGLGQIVYNWVADAWTHWPRSTVRLIGPTTTLQTSDRSRTYFAYLTSSGQTSQLLYMDSDSVDSEITRPLLIERGWIAPEATPQSDIVNREVWVQVYSNGYLNDDSQLVNEAGYSITVAFDFNDANAITRNWTAAEVFALQVGGKATLMVNCQANPSRAVKVTVQALFETGSDADFNPLDLTVVYAPTGALRRRVLKPGALK